MTRLELMILKSAPVRFLAGKSKLVTLPGTDDVTLFDVEKFFFKDFRNLKLTQRAAAVTYNFLMALPPTFLFLLSLVPYLPVNNVEQTILNTLNLLTPNSHIYKSVAGIITDFMGTQRRDVLSFGIILTLYFSSNGMMGLMKSFDRGLSVYKKRNGLSRRWTAVKLTIMLICVTLVSLAVLIIQSAKVNVWLLRIFHTVIAIKILSIIILILLVFCAISIIYAYGPSLTHHFKFVSVGSVFATTLSVVATFVFFFLVNHFLNYNKVYGSVGTLIAFMVWLWLNTLIILLGYELNVSILVGKLSHEDKIEHQEVK